MKLDSYPVSGDGSRFLNNKSASVRITSKRFTLQMDSFSLEYPLLQRSYRTVLGVLRADDDPVQINGISLVWVIFTRRMKDVAPVRVGVTYFRDLSGQYSASVVVDGFPVYVTSLAVPFNTAAVEDFVRTAQAYFKVL